MPRLALVTLNVRGLGHKKGFAKLLQVLQRRKNKEHIGAMAVQEHNLPPTIKEDLETSAKIAGFTLTITFGRADAPDSERGGVLILTVDSVIARKKVIVEEPGLIIMETEWGAKKLKIGNVYAPVQPMPRIDFFVDLRRKLNHIETDNLYLGGDFNCVGDVTLDVGSNNPLGYRNIGGTLLTDLTGEVSLIDERREQLGNDREYTRSGNTASGVTSTRIDRWFTPMESNHLLTFEVDNDYIFKKTASDHRAVTVTIDDKLGTRGKERDSIEEKLMEEAFVQDAVKKITDETYNSDRSEKKKWMEAQAKIHDLLMQKTKERKRCGKVKIKRLLGTLQRLKEATKGVRPTQKQLDGEKCVQQQIYLLQNPEVETDATERQSKLMFDRAEAGTKAFLALTNKRQDSSGSTN